jgi:hypothetical protein
VKKNYPNCETCKWLRNVSYFMIGYRKECYAQGGRLCENVYANKHCLNLYEKGNLLI